MAKRMRVRIEGMKRDYPSIYEAAQIIGCSANNLSDVLHGRKPNKLGVNVKFVEPHSERDHE